MSDITVNLQDAINITFPDARAGVQSVKAGSNISVDNTDPYNPIVSGSAGAGFSIIAAGGTADAITATYSPAITLTDLTLCAFTATAANATTTPTFAPNGLTAHTITRRGGAALIAGDIPGQYAVMLLEYNLANTRWELLNPANSVKADKFATARTIDGVSFDGSANITVIAPATDAATTKATPVDADELPMADSAASFILKKLTWANLKATFIATVQAWTGQQNFSIATLTSSSNHIAWNLNTQQVAKHTFTENTTLDNPTNMVAGGTYIIICTQHASSPKTLALGNAFKTPGGAGFTISATNSAIDVLTFVSDGTSMFMVGQKAFA